MRTRWLLGGTALIFVGCGGSGSSGIFPEDEKDASPADSSGPGVPTKDGATSTDAASEGDASLAPVPGTDAASALDSGASGGDGALGDATPPGSPAEGGTSPVSVDPGIWCGTNELTGNDVYCELGSAVCCLTPTPAPTAYACLSASTACSGISAACDKEADCTGGVCCADASGTTYGPLHCATSCSASDARFCDPTAKTDECASMGLACKADPVLIGYYSCN